MKILVVTPWYPTPESPQTGVFVRRDVDTLRMDHDVDVLHLAPRAGSDSAAPGVERTSYRVASPLSIVRAQRLIRRRAAGYDVVHSHAISALLAIPRRLPVPWVHTEHWSGALNPKTAGLLVRAAGAVLLRLLNGPDVVIAVSAALAAVVRRHRRGPVVVVPNAVMAPVSTPRPAIDELTLIGVGGLIPRKRPVLAVETLAALAGEGCDARLLWVGDGPERGPMLARAAELGVSERVDLRGDLPPESVSDELLAARVFLLPTQAETFGVAIAEALRHGLPVVVGDDGGHTEFVGESDGALVGSADPAAWADAVEAVLALDRAQIARRAEERFSEDTRRAAFADAYRVATETRKA